MLENTHAAEKKIVKNFNPIAIVNGNQIFIDDINKRVEVVAFINNVDKKDVKKIIMDKYIEEILILENAAKYNITTSNNEAIARLRLLEKNAKLKEGYFTNNKKIKSLDVIEYVSQQITIQKFMQGLVSSRVKVSALEIEQEMKRIIDFNGTVEFLLSEIFVSFSNKTQDDAYDIIKSVYEKLKKGADVNKLIMLYSDSMNKNKNGEIGWISQNLLPNEILAQLSNMGKNDFTTPIFKNNGFQIIILRDIRPFININVANPNEVAQIKNMLEDKIFNEKSESVVEDFLRDTYSKASINIISEY
jgi:parvulin-like peptidyl-prolyl isomerase